MSVKNVGMSRCFGRFGTARESETKTISLLCDKSVSRKAKIYIVLKTAVVVIVWMGLAMRRRMTGITLQDLLPRLGANYEITARALSFGTLTNIGALFAAFVCDRYKERADLLIGVGSICSAGFLCVVPWTRSVVSFAIVQGLSDLFSNGVAPVLQTVITWMWKGNSAVPFHLSLVGYTTGNLIMPLICEPFLSPDIAAADRQNVSNDSVQAESTTVVKPDLADGGFDSTIEIPYAITATVLAFCGTLFIIFQFSWRPANVEADAASVKDNEKKTLSTSSNNFCSKLSPKMWADGDLRYGTLILIGMSVFYVCLRGHVGTIGLFFFPFAIEGSLKFKKSEAIALVATSSSVVLGGRLVASLIAVFVPIEVMVAVESTGTVGFCIVLSFFLKSRVHLWVALCGYKLMAGCLWPGGYSLAAKYITPTATFFAWLRVIPSVIDFGLDWCAAYVFQNVGPDSIMVYCLICASVGLLALGIMQTYVSFSKSRPTKEPEADDQRNGTTEDNCNDVLLKETSV